MKFTVKKGIALCCKIVSVIKIESISVKAFQIKIGNFKCLRKYRKCLHKLIKNLKPMSSSLVVVQVCLTTLMM